MVELELPAHVDLAAAEQIKQAALGAAAEGGPLKLKAEGVASISGGGVQTVIAASRHMQAADGELVLVAPSETFMNAFEGLGFYAELMKVTFEQ